MKKWFHFDANSNLRIVYICRPFTFSDFYVGHTPNLSKRRLPSQGETPNVKVCIDRRRPQRWRHFMTNLDCLHFRGAPTLPPPSFLFSSRRRLRNLPVAGEAISQFTGARRHCLTWGVCGVNKKVPNHNFPPLSALPPPLKPTCWRSPQGGGSA